MRSWQTGHSSISFTPVKSLEAAPEVRSSSRGPSIGTSVVRRSTCVPTCMTSSVSSEATLLASLFARERSPSRLLPLEIETCCCSDDPVLSSETILSAACDMEERDGGHTVPNAAILQNVARKTTTKRPLKRKQSSSS